MYTLRSLCVVCDSLSVDDDFRFNTIGGGCPSYLSWGLSYLYADILLICSSLTCNYFFSSYYVKRDVALGSNTLLSLFIRLTGLALD
jgi:hypothetical protein